MAKKPKVSKTQAVRDYLKEHPGAGNVEIAAALTKQGIKITRGHVSVIKSKDSKTHAIKKAAKKPTVVEAPAVEKPAKNGDTLTLTQIKLVAATIKTLGGIRRVMEVLAVIKELGGVKKFRDLAEAMSATGTGDVSF